LSQGQNMEGFTFLCFCLLLCPSHSVRCLTAKQDAVQKRTRDDKIINEDNSQLEAHSSDVAGSAHKSSARIAPARDRAVKFTHSAVTRGQVTSKWVGSLVYVQSMMVKRALTATSFRLCGQCVAGVIAVAYMKGVCTST
jgi:hypothetical protein